MTDRESMSATPDCGGDAAAYALGALEPQEAEAFRAHMQQCAVCRDEVEALAGAVRALPMAARQYEPPRGLRRRVMGEVRSEGPLARRRRELVAGLAATVIAAAGAVTAVELSAGVAATVFQAKVSGIRGSAQVRVASGRAELLVHGLTPPGHGHVYEVWLKSGSAAPVPASVLFGVDPSGNADVGIPRAIHGVSAVMVTKEPLGGTSKPTNTPVIVASLTSAT